MSRVDFYHLQKSPLERALPELLERVIANDLKAVVVAGSEARVQDLDSLLWSYRADSWLPHGSIEQGASESHPIWLTSKLENPNAAEVLVITEGVDIFDVKDFSRCLDLFDGTMGAEVEAARGRWKKAKDEGHDLIYWQQDENGRWTEKAKTSSS